MDIDSILMAKKFSGAGAAARAEAAAARAEAAAVNIPDDFTDVLTTMTEFQQDLAAVETTTNNVASRMNTVESSVAAAVETANNAASVAQNAAEGSAGLTFTNSGSAGDEIRTNGDGTYFYGGRPTTLLRRLTITGDPATDMSDVSWITTGDNKVTGFEITTADNGTPISSLNMKHCLITVTNVVNPITNEATSQGTALWDIRYSTSTQGDRNYHGSMYHTLNYENLHELCYELGINPAGTAYIALETGTSTTSGQMFPGGVVTTMPRKYCLYNGTTKIEAITLRLLVGTFTPDTVIRIWRID